MNASAKCYSCLVGKYGNFVPATLYRYKGLIYANQELKDKVNKSGGNFTKDMHE